MKIGLLVSDNWFQRSKSVMVLSNYLQEIGIECEECCWETTNDWKKYDAILISSAWGYHNAYERYLEVLSDIEKETLLFNTKSIVAENIYKERQLQLLKKNGLPIIDTVFFSINSEEEGLTIFKYSSGMDLLSIIEKEIHSKEFVLKPTVSASGNHTVMYTQNLAVQNRIFTEEGLKQYCEMVFSKNPGVKIMVQPFIRGIEDGEYALVYINKCFSHAVMRYPGVLGVHKKAEVIVQVPEDVLNLGNKIANLMWKKDMLYMRVDLVRENEEIKVMEIECNEPELYFYRLDENTRAHALKLLTDHVLERGKRKEFGII